MNLILEEEEWRKRNADAVQTHPRIPKLNNRDNADSLTIFMYLEIYTRYNRNTFDILKKLQYCTSLWYLLLIEYY